MSNTAAIAIILNPYEEPYFIYVNKVLEMKSDKPYSLRSYDWLKLIQKYQSFSSVVERYYLTDEAYEKFKDNVGLIPINFENFDEDDIYPHSDL